MEQEQAAEQEQREQEVLSYNTDLAELIGCRNNITDKKQSSAFPFLDKSMQFANLSAAEVLDIKDDLLISNIVTRTKMTRGQKTRAYDRGDFVSTRALLTAGLSLAKDGMFTKRITGAYSHIESSTRDASVPTQAGNKKGLFGLFKHKPKGDIEL